jgi:hypothetical protein
LTSPCQDTYRRKYKNMDILSQTGHKMPILP